MTNTYKIIPASLTDIPSLVKLVNSAYRGESSKKGWTTEADLLGGIRVNEKTLTSIFQKPSDIILKCCDADENIIGCVHLQPQHKKIYLGMLTVSPQLQTNGIGKLLLTASENYAKENNFGSIIMTVISIRKELIAWYERRGYVNTGKTKPFPNDPNFGIPKQELKFIVMEKKV
ncbi:MAG: GNAT family N-acetyltransferase [Bacteroidota bacterium]|nr:GNAT family N-acetyltransferase [Bacteroidota bacterium]